jgi:AmmeMemoRadiSam system protein B
LNVARSSVRAPVAAGSFYPGRADVLRAGVDRLLDEASGPASRSWGIIVPHAGYRYSGPIAATAFASFRSSPTRASRVLLLGPAHFVPLQGCAVPAAERWRTPLGDVEIDTGLRTEAVSVGCVVDDRPHAPEHSIEVQVPFLQRLFGTSVQILPVAVGRTLPSQVCIVLERLGARVDLVVVSTDLSHYLDQETARAVDRATANAVVARDEHAIGRSDACGVYALRGAVAFARTTNRSIRLLDLRTSGDTVGGPDRVVGYGAFAVG